MTFWLVTVVYLGGLALGLAWLARLFKGYTDDLERFAADLFERVRIQDREMELHEDD